MKTDAAPASGRAGAAEKAVAITGSERVAEVTPVAERESSTGGDDDEGGPSELTLTTGAPAGNGSTPHASTVDGGSTAEAGGSTADGGSIADGGSTDGGGSDDGGAMEDGGSPPDALWTAENESPAGGGSPTSDAPNRAPEGGEELDLFG